MKRIFLLIGIFCFLASCSINNNLLHKKVNQRDENGLRKGIWISYWDDNQKIPMSKAWFKNDKEYQSKEYHINGKLRLKMKWKKDGWIKVKYYDTLRHIEEKGTARIEFNKDDIHYYYEGWWKYFNSKHKLIAKRLFSIGEIKEEIFFETSEIEH